MSSVLRPSRAKVDAMNDAFLVARGGVGPGGRVARPDPRRATFIGPALLFFEVRFPDLVARELTSYGDRNTVRRLRLLAALGFILFNVTEGLAAPPGAPPPGAAAYAVVV